MPAYTRYTDPAMNTFKKTNMYYATDPMLRYQDPTYLGFKLFFLFDQPGCGLLSELDLPNTAYHYLINRGYPAKAEYLKKFIQLFKKINSTTPWFFQSVEGLDEAWKHLYQDPDFKPLIPKDRKITINCLDESIDLRITALMDLYRKACFDWPNRREIVPLNLRRFKVGIYVYEGRNINRSGTPFRYSDIQDPSGVAGLEPSEKDKAQKKKVEDEKKRMDILLGPDPNSSDSIQSNTQDYINPNISRILLNFEYCEFMPDDSNGTLAAISNKEFALKAQKIVFSYRNVSEDNIYRFHHDQSVTDTMIGTLDGLALDNPALLEEGEYPIKGPGGILERFKNQKLDALERALAPFKLPNSKKLEKALGSEDGNIYGLSLLEDSIQNLPQIAKDAARRAVAEVLRAGAPLRSLFNGNVFGFSTATVAGAALGGGVGAAAQLALQEAGKNASLKTNKTNDVDKTIGNNFSESPSLLNKTKVFGGGVFFDDFVPSINNGEDENPTGNYGDNSGSLQNDTSDRPSDLIGESDNWGYNSASLNNDNPLPPQAIGTNDSPDSVDNAPNGNYGTNSGSLNNDNPLPPQAIGTNDSPDSVDNAPNGNYGTNSGSLNNGIDEDPTGNYGEGSPSLNND